MSQCRCMMLCLVCLPKAMQEQAQKPAQGCLDWLLFWQTGDCGKISTSGWFHNGKICSSQIGLEIFPTNRAENSKNIWSRLKRTVQQKRATKPSLGRTLLGLLRWGFWFLATLPHAVPSAPTTWNETNLMKPPGNTPLTGEVTLTSHLLSLFS